MNSSQRRKHIRATIRFFKERLRIETLRGGGIDPVRCAKNDTVAKFKLQRIWRTRLNDKLWEIIDSPIQENER